jgi:uncharacterized YccA/Bax inhibitor family protein
MLRSNNPALRPGVFDGWRNTPGMSLAAAPATMTIQGTVNCSLIMLGVLVASATGIWSWLAPSLEGLKAGRGGAAIPSAAIPTLIGSLIGGLVLALIIGFKPRTAPYLAVPYAALEGVVVGAVSVITAFTYKGGPGLVFQAAGLTFAICFGLLAVYKTGLIKPSENFKLGVAAATLGLCVFALGSWLLRMVGVGVPTLESMGTLGIVIAGGVVLLATLNLVLDFDYIEEGTKNGAPKFMEWYAAFGLMATLIWLYLSILRFLRLLSGRD